MLQRLLSCSPVSEPQCSHVSSLIKAGMGVITDLDQKTIGVPFAVWGSKSGSCGGGPMPPMIESALPSVVRADATTMGLPSMNFHSGRTTGASQGVA